MEDSPPLSMGEETVGETRQKNLCAEMLSKWKEEQRKLQQEKSDNENVFKRGRGKGSFEFPERKKLRFDDTVGFGLI